MYGITLTQALILFIGITQVVATPIPNDGIKFDGTESTKEVLDAGSIIPNLRTSKPVVHEDGANWLSLPEWYRKRSGDKPKRKFSNESMRDRAS